MVRQAIRQAIRQAHGPEQRRRTHHPEPSRRVNHNDQKSKSQTSLDHFIAEVHNEPIPAGIPVIAGSYFIDRQNSFIRRSMLDPLMFDVRKLLFRPKWMLLRQAAGLTPACRAVAR
jgi:hypothetical protein